MFSRSRSRREARRRVAAFALAAVSLWVPSRARAVSAVVVNEVLYDAVGSDTGQEWVELYNAGSEAADLSGWRIERGGTSFSVVATLPGGTSIAPGGFLVVGESSVPDASLKDTLTFQNGDGATDGIRLVTAEGGVVDVLLYDAPNVNGLSDETGNHGASFAPDAPEGHSLARVPDGADTNASAADFHDTSSPTPGSANVLSAQPSGPSGEPSGVVVNEVLPNPVGSDADGEFIELFNPTGEVASLGGAQLDDADGGSSPYTIPAGTTIARGGYLSFPQSETGIAFNNDGDAARLLAGDGSLVASLTYGKVPQEGASWARKADGSADWTVSPTAGAPNAFAPLPSATAAKSGSNTPTPSPSTSSPTPRIAGATPTKSSQPPRSAIGNVAGQMKGTAGAGTPPVQGAAIHIEDPDTEGFGRESADAEASEAGATDAPAPPSEHQVEDSSPSARFPVSAILAWSAAGIVGIWRFLVTRRG